MSTVDLSHEHLAAFDRKPVQVLWHDAYAGIDAWTAITDIANEPRKITSIGWLLHGRVDRHLVIAQSVDGDHVDGLLVIPIEMVRTVKAMKVAK